MERINAMISSAYLSVPSIRQVTYNLQKINQVAAVPLVALVGLEMISGAEGGPLAYSACVLTCSAVTLFKGLEPCLALCGPLLNAPIP